VSANFQFKRSNVRVRVRVAQCSGRPHMSVLHVFIVTTIGEMFDVLRIWQLNRKRNALKQGC